MPRSTRASLLAASALLFLPSCGGKIATLYEQSKAEALADPGPAPANWAADGELGLSWDLVTTLAVRELQSRLEDPDNKLKIDLPLGAQAVITPKLAMSDTSVAASNDCATCVRVKSTFEGKLKWKLESWKGSVPVAMSVKAVLELTSRTEGAKTLVEAELRKVTVDLPESPSIDRLNLSIDDPLVAWLQEQIEREFPAIPIAELGSGDMPLRAVRLSTSKSYLEAEVLTTSPTRPSSALSPASAGDWYLSIDEHVLLGLTRRDAFEAGELTHEVYADPRSLSVQHQSFTMGLRLWRLAGMGWWRDYQVSGTLTLDGDDIQIEPEQVAEVDHSRGAGIVDPLALLAEGMILGAIEEALHVARPATLEEPIGGARLVLTVDQAEGANGALSLQGSATIEESAKKQKSKGTGKKKGKGKSKR